MTWKSNLHSPRSSDIKTPHVQQQQSKMSYIKLLWMWPVLICTLTSQNKANYSCKWVNSCHMPIRLFAWWSHASPKDRTHHWILKFSVSPRSGLNILSVHIQPVPFQHMLLKSWSFAGITISDSINTLSGIPKQCGLALPGQVRMLLTMFLKG